MESLMPTEYGTCYRCGRQIHTEKHHCIHGTANRRVAEQEGLWVWLCRECHTAGKYAVHRYRDADLDLMKDAQMVWEENYIKEYPYKNHAKEAAREAWIRLFGKSWLWEEEDD